MGMAIGCTLRSSSGKGCNSVGRQVTWLFFLMVWTVPGPMESALVIKKEWPQGRMMG